MNDTENLLDERELNDSFSNNSQLDCRLFARIYACIINFVMQKHMKRAGSMGHKRKNTENIQRCVNLSKIKYLTYEINKNMRV